MKEKIDYQCWRSVVIQIKHFEAVVPVPVAARRKPTGDAAVASTWVAVVVGLARPHEMQTATLRKSL